MIDSYSAFYYGYKINAQPYNGFINLREGAGPELSIQIPVGSYTLNTLVQAIRNALLSQATLDYQVSANRLTRRITISANSTFTLLTSTGSNLGTSIWSLIGFDSATDKTGATSYTGSNPSGKAYYPQFPLQSYVSDDDFQGRNQASKNVGANGRTVEVINFGLAKFVEFDIKFITSRADVSDGVLIKKNSRGLEDARDFLRDITALNKFEFMEDLNAPGNFKTCIVESMPSFQDGTGYKLRELFNENLRDIYETGIIKLRVVE